MAVRERLVAVACDPEIRVGVRVIVEVGVVVEVGKGVMEGKGVKLGNGLKVGLGVMVSVGGKVGGAGVLVGKGVKLAVAERRISNSNIDHVFAAIVETFSSALMTGPKSVGKVQALAMNSATTIQVAMRCLFMVSPFDIATIHQVHQSLAYHE